jgi:hypothetical protein
MMFPLDYAALSSFDSISADKRFFWLLVAAGMVEVSWRG